IFMRSNSKHSDIELERYIQRYLDEGISYKDLSKNFGLLLSESTFGQKVLRYQACGFYGIQSKSKNRHYSKEFKKSVVGEHLEEGTPIKQLARKYNIPTHSTVRSWIIKYTKGEEIRSYSPKPEVYTM